MRIILACALAGILSVPAKAQSLKEQLVGAWTLVSCGEFNGVKLPWCASPNGIQILDARGRYMTTIAERGRPKFTNPRAIPRDAHPAEEYKAAAMGLFAQFGTWSVNEAEKTIAYHVDGALFPNIEGTDAKVTISLSGDELKIGSGVWQRMKK